jgi:LuxR family maltose regulon positive regulatory protein
MLDTDIRRTPPHAVDRPALRARLDAGLGSPLSLVVAPAGAGKTVLLSQWRRAHPELPFAWLDVTPVDGDAIAFARRLVRTLQTAAPRFRVPVSPVAGTDRLGDAFLEDLAEGLVDAGPVVLVLDDLDRISGSPILPDLWRLVDLVPPGTHVVFSSRVDLQLGWSRHRLQHGLVEIRQSDLAFDDETTARVLSAITGRPVPRETAASVTASTEGWAVGVQLTALGLRFSPEPDRVVEVLADTDRLVVDYLSEEVLDGMAPERRDALMRLAVLDEVTAGLVETVTGLPGAAFIAGLERDSLFFVPVPGNPGWYRFHRLFRDLLLIRLRVSSPSQEQVVLERAADWLVEAGHPDAAVEYLLRARRWDRVILHARVAASEAFTPQRAAAVVRWLGQVPPEVRTANPDVELLRGVSEMLTGRGSFAVDDLRALVAGGRLDPGQRVVALASIAGCVAMLPHPEVFADTAQRALDELDRHPDVVPPDLYGLTSRPVLAAVSQVALGRAHLMRGALGEARRVLRAALVSDGITLRPARIGCLGSLAVVEALSGRLSIARDHADEALVAADEADLVAHPSTADAYFALSLIGIYRGEYETAALALAEARTRAEFDHRTQLLWLAQLIDMILDPAQAELVGDDLPGPPPGYIRQATVSISMRRARLKGQKTVAAPSPAWSVVAFEEVAGLLSFGQPAAARERLAQLRFDADPLAPLPAIELEILVGWMCALEGKRPAAREHLQSALDTAEPEWLVHPFVRAGPRVADLIDDLPSTPTEFRRQVIQRMRASAADRGPRLADDLTPRELELLAFLPSRLTIADIAARCYVSTNTIKTHFGHIYRKLGVTGRDAAIERARQLGLIDDGQIARVG